MDATSEEEMTASSYSRREPMSSVPHLLQQRQTSPNFFRTARKDSQLELLASRIAWNPKRLTNMILCVGPGTPASVLSSVRAQQKGDDDPSSSSSDDAQHNTGDEAESLEIDDEDEEELDDASSVMAGRMLFEGGDGAGEQRQERISLEEAERTLMQWMAEQQDSDDDEDEDDNEALHHTVDPTMSQFVPSIRHGGCINTACWLTSPWRLRSTTTIPSSLNDTPTASAVSSQEVPTQLLTSGDDRQVKFWDVRHAMGMTSPWEGGKDTATPFSSPIVEGPPIQEWRRRRQSGIPPPGMVLPLATLQTRHQGNVFHITPMDRMPGQVLTCAADGYLRLSHLESNISSVVMSPTSSSQNDLPALLSFRPGMCFSHSMLDLTTGVLCSEEGLRLFDTRLNPSDQSRRVLVGSGKAKCCAVWSSDSIDSTYVFSGGNSSVVRLYDLRMTGSAGAGRSENSSSRVVQSYCPRSLSLTSAVSVSGLDLSKDKRELLVSYENDQIYTFPVFPQIAQRPTIDELDDFCRGADSYCPDLASYGGHLNRYTFLKNARYAGLQDEYICTGSDSGHAWLYHRQTGAVAALMNADHSTCNGVVPHPTLPFFVSYGIDSTAKLWRATLPVDQRVDDSPQGRRARLQQEETYEPSSVVSSWKQVEDLMDDSDDGDEDAALLLPDDVPRDPDILHRGMFGGLPPLFLLRRHHTARRPPFIGNDLRQLPHVIRQNLFSAVHARGEEDPIKSSLLDLKRRVSWIRLHYQAMERGLTLKEAPDDRFKLSSFLESTTDPADLIPAHPSDWLPFDDRFTLQPHDHGLDLCMNHSTAYQTFAFQRHGTVAKDFIERQERRERRRKPDSYGGAEQPNESRLLCASSTPSSESTTKGDEEFEELSNATDDSGTDEPMNDLKADEAEALLYETASILKESGNKALHEGNIALAARRYDSALQYGAVALVSFPGQKSCRLKYQTEEDGWSPLRKLIVTVRLNLCMALLKPGPTNSNKLALDQAIQAIQELEPFLGPMEEEGNGREGVSEREPRPEPGINGENGVVCHPNRGISNGSTGSGNEFNQEAQELLVKAYYRCGTAQMHLGEYKDAIKAFEESLSQNAKSSSDTAIQRSLAEAKRKQAHRNKRQRKKYKEALFSST